MISVALLLYPGIGLAIGVDLSKILEGQTQILGGKCGKTVKLINA